jgi:hypothetical protein
MDVPHLVAEIIIANISRKAEIITDDSLIKRPQFRGRVGRARDTSFDINIKSRRIWRISRALLLPETLVIIKIDLDTYKTLRLVHTAFLDCLRIDIMHRKYDLSMFRKQYSWLMQLNDYLGFGDYDWYIYPQHYNHPIYSEYRDWFQHYFIHLNGLRWPDYYLTCSGCHDARVEYFRPFPFYSS